MPTSEGSIATMARRRLPTALIRLTARQASESSDVTPYRDEEADRPSHNVSPLTIGLVAGLLSLVMVVALAFMFRQHMRRQRRRNAELLPSPATAPSSSSSAPPSMREKSRSRQTSALPISSGRSAKSGKHGRSKSASSAGAATGLSETAPSRSRPAVPTLTRAGRPAPPSSTKRAPGPFSSSADSSEDEDDKRRSLPLCPPPLPDLVPARSGSLSSGSTLSRSSSTAARPSFSSSPSDTSVASTADGINGIGQTRPSVVGRDETAVVGGERAYDQECRRGSNSSANADVVDK